MNGTAQPGAFCSKGNRLTDGAEKENWMCRSLAASPVSLQYVTTVVGNVGVGVGE
jgi:hypothetical protein